MYILRLIRLHSWIISHVAYFSAKIKHFTNKVQYHYNFKQTYVDVYFSSFLDDVSLSTSGM